MDTVTKTQSTEMTEAHWQVAHAIAQTLVKQETDVNELGKSIAYLRSVINQNQADAGSRFFKYLRTLVNNGRTIGHSGRTLDYYRSLEKACSDYLLSYQTEPAVMLHILGWVVRLMRYYREGGAIGEELDTLAKQAPTVSPQVLESERQAEIRAVAESQGFQLNQLIGAVIKTIKGKEVTYQLPGEIKLTVKEPKKYESLSIGQSIVEILELRESGVPKRVTQYDCKVGEKLSAEIKEINGEEITYKLMQGFELKVEESEDYEALSIGKVVQVEILELAENRVPKRIKRLN